MVGLHELGISVKSSALMLPRRAWGGLPLSLFYGRPLSYPNELDWLARRINEVADRTVNLKHRIDLIHTTYYSSWRPPGNLPHVATLYDCIHERFPSQFAAQDRARRFKAMQLERADAIVCISEATLNDLESFYPEFLHKARVIPLGLSPAFNSSYKIPPEPRWDSTLIFVGSRRGYKAFDLLTKAISLLRATKIPDLQLIALGGGDFTNQELRNLKRLGFDKSNFKHYKPSDKDMKHFYVKATALVFPSSFEGFGYPPLEAMALGCPVVVAKTSSLPEVVGDAGHYFQSGNVESLTAAILEMFEADGIRRLKVERGLKRADKLSSRTTAELTANLYDELC
jgi:glycosyltransferase involved in cell wall biosynthesis